MKAFFFYIGECYNEEHSIVLRIVSKKIGISKKKIRAQIDEFKETLECPSCYEKVSEKLEKRLITDQTKNQIMNMDIKSILETIKNHSLK